MRVAFFYFVAFVLLMAGIAALADHDYIGAFTCFALFLGMPMLAKAAA